MQKVLKQEKFTYCVIDAKTRERVSQFYSRAKMQSIKAIVGRLVMSDMWLFRSSFQTLKNWSKFND